MAALGLLGEEPKQPTERQLGRFQRGKDAQTYYGREKLEAKYGTDGVEHEPAVAWPAPPALPIGELHPDFYIPAERMTVEVKSSEAVDSMFEMSLLQAKGQVHFHPEAESGMLVFLDRDYQETDVFPVIVSAEDAEEIESIAAAVVHAGKTGELPPRVCETPSDGVQHMCPFIEQCFAGWQPPEQQVRDDIAPIVAEAYLAKRDLDAAKGMLGPHVERWEKAKAALDAADLPQGLTAAGQMNVRRTVVSDSERFSLAKATKLGLFTAADRERFDSVIRLSEGYSRYSFERLGDEPLDLGRDLGDVPF